MSLGASNAGALDRGLQVLVAAVLLMFTNGRLDSWSDASRLATIESLVHRGTFTIDGSPYQHTGDRVAVPGRGFLGHHPPALALVLAGPAWLLEKAGVEFEPDGGAMLWWLTLLSSGLPALAGLVLCLRWWREAGVSAAQRLFWGAALALGTLWLPYGVVLQGHLLAGFLVLVGYRCLHGHLSSAVGGCALAGAVAIDSSALPAAAVVTLAGMRPGQWRALFMGAAGPAALFLGLNHRLGGDLRPLASHLEFLDYPYSPFAFMAPTGRFYLEDRGAYFMEMLLGGSGLFSLSPVLLLALLGAVARCRGPRGGHRRAAGTVVLAVGATVAVFGLLSDNMGGSAVGIRWFTVLCPLLILWGPWTPPLPGSRVFVRALAVGLLAVSATLATVGAVRPWTKVHLTPAGDEALAGVDRPWRDQLAREWKRISSRGPVDLTRGRYLADWRALVGRWSRREFLLGRGDGACATLERLERMTPDDALPAWRAALLRAVGRNAEADALLGRSSQAVGRQAARHTATLLGP